MASDCAVRKIEAMKRQGLIDARKRAGLTQEKIAELMNVSVPQVSRWENGRDGIPSQRMASLVAAYGAPIDDLLQGADILETGLPPSNAKVVKYEGPADVKLPRNVPIFGTALGAPKDFDGKAIEQTMLNSGEVVGYLPRPTVLNGQDYAYGLWVQGSSMAPRHEDGETVFVQDSRKGRPPRIGDDVVVYLVDPDEVLEDDHACATLVKRLVRRSASYVELEQFNPPHIFRIETSRIMRIDRVIPWSELLS